MKPEHALDNPAARLLERLHSCIDHGDKAMARQLLSSLESHQDGPRLAYARWRALSLDEDLKPAEAAIRSAAERFPERPELHHALGWTLSELGRPDEAIKALRESCRIDPMHADSWHDLAIALETTGDQQGMREAFTRVYELDTNEATTPNLFATEEILAWADRAVRLLPQEVQDAVRVLPIFIQDYPDDWILEEAPWDPRLLGLFDGPTLAQWEGIDGPGSTPHVYLFQRNLERLCPDPRLMAEQVRITIHHEIGHFLGLDELELIDRGLG
ncbi:MAG: hypothetical protein CMP23_11950 [Rickettsiales bacterium]|nr:hypothetical protein [Rickettsiales bacterium]